MKRYDQGRIGMNQSLEGDWVEFSEVRKEIESLREAIRDREMLELEASTECEEWKRRCLSVIRLWKERYPMTALRKRYGDVDKWFEEE